jgi:hypothetical protein
VLSSIFYSGIYYTHSLSLIEDCLKKKIKKITLRYGPPKPPERRIFGSENTQNSAKRTLCHAGDGGAWSRAAQEQRAAHESHTGSP